MRASRLTHPRCLMIIALAGVTFAAAAATGSAAATAHTRAKVDENRPAVSLSRVRQRQTPDGRVAANGRGTAIFEGQMVLYGQVAGRRSPGIRVIDTTGDAQVVMNGSPVTPRRSGRYREFRMGYGGLFVISGSGLRVTITAERLNLSAAGAGQVRLAGSGSYSVNEQGPFRWNGRTFPMNVTPRRAPTQQRRSVAPVRTTSPVAGGPIAPPPPSTAPVAQPATGPSPAAAPPSPGPTAPVPVPDLARS